MTAVVRALSKVYKTGSPFQFLSQHNVVRQVADPGGIAAERMANGDPINTSTALDPGGVFTQTTAQKKSADERFNAAAAQASAPTIDSAGMAANQTADRLRRRRGVLANIFGGSKSSTLG